MRKIELGEVTTILANVGAITGIVFLASIGNGSTGRLRRELSKRVFSEMLKALAPENR